MHTVLAKHEKLLRIKGIFVSGIVSHLVYLASGFMEAWRASSARLAAYLYCTLYAYGPHNQSLSLDSTTTEID